MTHDSTFNAHRRMLVGALLPLAVLLMGLGPFHEPVGEAVRGSVSATVNGDRWATGTTPVEELRAAFEADGFELWVRTDIDEELEVRLHLKVARTETGWRITEIAYMRHHVRWTVDPAGARIDVFDYDPARGILRGGFELDGRHDRYGSLRLRQGRFEVRR